MSDNRGEPLDEVMERYIEFSSRTGWRWWRPPRASAEACRVLPPHGSPRSSTAARSCTRRRDRTGTTSSVGSSPPRPAATTRA
jgi:hypothetical protein